MIKIVQKKAGSNRLCYAKNVGLALLLLVRSSLFGMHSAGGVNSEIKQDIAPAQETAIAVQAEQDPVEHWDRVSILLTLSNRRLLEDEYSKKQLGAVLSLLQHSPVGTMGRAAYDDLVRVQLKNAQLKNCPEEKAQMADLYDEQAPQRAHACMLPILAELHKQNNQRQELAESKISMNCSACSWWWLLNWSSRVAWVMLLSAFPSRFQCPK